MKQITLNDDELSYARIAFQHLISGYLKKGYLIEAREAYCLYKEKFDGYDDCFSKEELEILRKEETREGGD